MSLTNNLPNAPNIIKAIENGHGQKPINFNEFENSLPSRVGIHEKFVPNAGLHLGFMPFFLVENLVIPLQSNGLKSNTAEEMPNFDHLTEFVRDHFTKNGLFPIETIEVAGPNSAQFMHNIGGPPSSPPSLNTIPKFMLDRFISVRKTKDALLRDASRRNTGSPLVYRHRIMPNGPNEDGLLATT